MQGKSTDLKRVTKNVQRNKNQVILADRDERDCRHALKAIHANSFINFSPNPTYTYRDVYRDPVIADFNYSLNC